MKAKKLITVVVCTFNRATYLNDAIPSLRILTTPIGHEIEILVVDNASTDQTPAVVEQLSQGAGHQVRYVHEPNQGIAHARNRGIRESSGAWIAYFDDDQIADPNWLVELIAGAERYGTSCVGGSVKLRLPDDYQGRLSNACRILLSESPDNLKAVVYGGRRTPGCGNILLERKLLDQVGEFDTSATMGGEDTDLFRRIQASGVVAWYEPQAIIYHRVPHERLTASYLMWNARRTGAHVADVEHRHYGKLKFLFRFFARLLQAMIKFPKLFWRSRLANNSDDRLGANCIIAAGEAYTRRSAQWYLPRLCSQSNYFAKLDFRSEREQFGS